MELINYLHQYFYTKSQLTELAVISSQDLLAFQQQGVMPTCSYKLALNYTGDSFLGEFSQQEEVEFYAKEYVSWLNLLKETNNPEEVFQIFALRYRQKLKQLNKQGYSVNDDKLDANINQHIEAEWQHFLNGTYGLCTKSGLPEDIAAKELAILKINEILALNPIDTIGDVERLELTKAVNLLDSASALFAPHERLQSSRHRLVDEVRRNYKLPD